MKTYETRMQILFKKECQICIRVNINKDAFYFIGVKSSTEKLKKKKFGKN